MKYSRERLIKYLESKKTLFEEMEKALLAQKSHLHENRLDEFACLSGKVDKIIERIKNIDYDVARLESDELSLSGMINSGDEEVKKAVDAIMRISRKNNDLINELAGILKASSRDLKAQLGDSPEMSRPKGYGSDIAPSSACPIKNS